MSEQSVFQHLKQFLDANGVRYTEIHHEPTRTSEESAKARGVDVAIGGKAIVMKVDDVFKLFVVSAARKIDSSAVKKQHQARKIRFASPEELLDLTGLVPGSVPPFGRPILPFDIHVDDSVAEQDDIAFNAGSLTDSIIMKTKDYLAVAQPVRALFSA